jgi:DNA-binding MarR family transcriptional regulator
MENELYEKLSHIQWLLHKRHMRGWANRGPITDTTRGQGRILALLKLQDGISTKDLSYLLGVRISSLNETLSKMEKNGYVTREPSEQDKRVMLVCLTEKGKTEKQLESYDFNDTFSCLSNEEQQIFGEFLDRIIAAINIKTDDYIQEKTEDWHERMEALRARYRDNNEFFAMYERRFPEGRGFPYDPRMGFDRGRPHRDSFMDRRGFKEQDREHHCERRHRHFYDCENGRGGYGNE